MTTDWASRLVEMEDWYRDLLSKGDANAQAALLADYEPHAAFFRSLKGRVLDVGGGAGLTARYLGADTDYWVIDPAAVWSEAEWDAFGGAFRRGGPTRHCVAGTGEALPFDDGAFDAVLALWSLNHADDPRRCIVEMARVLRRGGTMLLVLEDMAPAWRDVARLAGQRIRWRLGRGLPHIDWGQETVRGLKPTIRHKLSGRAWPLQDDHIHIDETMVRAPEFGLRRRDWVGGFLTLEFRRK